MLSKHWKSRAAMFMTLAVLGTILLPGLTNFKVLAQTSSVQLSPLCTDVEISQHIEELDTGEPAAFDALVACNSQAVPALITALRETQDENVRIITIAALGEIGVNAAPATTAALTESLQDKSRDVRVATVQALGNIGTDAVPALITALKDEGEYINDEYVSSVRSDAIDALGKIGKDAVPALIAVLKDEDWNVGYGAATALGKIGKEAVPALFAALKDENSLARSRAASALTEVGVEVIPDLIQALQDTDSKVRSGAADALGDIGFEAKSAVPALMMAFQDIDSQVRSSAAYALVQIGIEPKSAVPVLRTVIHDKDTRENSERAWTERIVRSWAILALADIGAEAIPDLIQALNDRRPLSFFNSEERALVKIGQDAVPALIAALQSQERHIRCSAASVIGEIGIEEKIVVSALITALKRNTDVGIDICITDAFGQIDRDVAKFAVSALITALQDENSNIRSNAAYALGQIGKEAKSAVPALITAFQDQDEDYNAVLQYKGISQFLRRSIRSDAAYALGQIGEETNSTVSALITALQDENSTVRSNTAHALGLIGQKNPESTVPALITALQDENSDVRLSTAYALGLIGEEAKSAVPALITALQDEDEEHYINILQDRGVSELLSSIRSNAAYALGLIGEEAKSAVPALITALQDEDEDVRLSAAIAIVKIGGNPKDVIPVLVAAIKYEHVHGYLCGWHSESAHGALVEIGKDAVPVLIDALNDKYAGFKYGAVLALGEIGADAKDAVPELTKIFLDRNEDIWIRDEAIKALKKIASSEAILVLERYKETTDAISHWVAGHPNLGICVLDPARPVREATTNYVSTRPPAICRIRAIRAVLRWKCP